MSKARGRKRPKAPKDPPKPPDQPKKHWSRGWRFFVGLIATVAAVIGFLSAVATFVPRLQIDVSELFDPRSPLPASVTIRNQFLPLKEVSFLVRICESTDASSQGHIIGLKSCTGTSEGGGITMPSWQGHRLMSDDRWDILLGSSVPFFFNTGDADVRLVVKYWPQYLPHPWFIPLREKEARLKTRKKPDGQTIWLAEPID